MALFTEYCPRYIGFRIAPMVLVAIFFSLRLVVGHDLVFVVFRSWRRKGPDFHIGLSVSSHHDHGFVFFE